MEIEIFNCNNIRHGNLQLAERTLNIKHAPNGTGKSTIANVLQCIEDSAALSDYLPYDYLTENPLSAGHAARVICSTPLSKVKVFNEDFVNQYVFLNDELLKDSFEIFVKTRDYESRMKKIQELIVGVQNAFHKNSDLEALIKQLSIFVDGCGKAKSGYSAASAIGKSLAKGNKIEHIPKKFAEFSSYIRGPKNAEWIAWQNKGNQFWEIDTANHCPYCATAVAPERKAVVQEVGCEYDAKYFTELTKILEVLQSLRDFFDAETNQKITEMLAGVTQFTKAQTTYIGELRKQVETLRDCLEELRYLNFASLKDADKIAAKLEEKKIDLSLFGHLNTTYTQSRILPVNTALDEVIQQAGRLQGEVAQQKKYIQEIVSLYQNEINSFLKNAGYCYEVRLVENNSSYRLVLMPLGQENVISNVKRHLSYGERNAFALVLFMYQAIKDNPDLVILDDPISSFDKNKKYAIIDMLFRGKNSFKGHTVMMLTHDFDPIVDLIHERSISSRFNPLPVASYLSNQNGVLTEIEITPDDVIPFYQIADTIMAGSADSINKLIYLRRRLEACNQKGLAWELLSNVFHSGRETPNMKDPESHELRAMSPEEIACAEKEIQEWIPDFSYATTYARAYDMPTMISLYHNTTCGYEKVQLYRMLDTPTADNPVFKKYIDESYHVENDYLFQLNPEKYELVPPYILEYCNNGVALLQESLTPT